MCEVFLALFSNLLSLVFFLNCGDLFCLTWKSMKITIKEQREKTERKTKKKNHIQWQKNNLVRGHSFITSAKKVWKSGSPSPPLPQTSNFGLSSPTLDVPNWHWIPLGNFEIFLEKVNNEIQIVTYNFFSLLMHTIFNIYYFHKYNRTDRDANRLSSSRVSSLYKISYKGSIRMETV